MSEPRSEVDVVGKVADSFLARYRRGERPSLSEYVASYPELAEEIRELFPALVVMEELGSTGEHELLASACAAAGSVPKYLGDYRIVREIGRGGMGVVYEAVQESLGRHVALKVLSFHSLLPATHLERFRREARAAACLHHTNIVPVYGVGECDGVHYYAMQYIQGQALDQVLKEVKRFRGPKGPAKDPSRVSAEGLPTARYPAGVASGEPTRTAAPPPGASELPATPTVAGSSSGTVLTTKSDAQYFRSVAQMGVQIATGLDYAHKQGIVHRDVKPSNLLLDARGTVWITDFGLAKSEGCDELTRTGDIVGTLRYMAPERFRGHSDPRSDVYGLGVTLYELLTLRPAFEDSDRARLSEQITHDDPPWPRAVDRSIPRDLETIVLKAIAKEPNRRYQTAAEVAEDLGRFVAGEPVRARRIGRWERTLKWVKRRPALAASLVFSAAAVLALLAFVTAHNVQLERTLQEVRTEREIARRNQRSMTRELAVAKVNESQARRASGLVGQRFESLKALKIAMAHFRTLDQLDDKRLLELRNEVIACLPLADVNPSEVSDEGPGWTRPTAVDPALQRYVVRSVAADQPEKQAPGAGDLSVRWVANGREVARLPGFGVRVVGDRFSPDGRYLAVHYEWGQRHIYVWDIARREAVIKVPLGQFEAFPSFSPDSRRVALAQPDYSIRIYELPSGTLVKTLPPGPRVQLVHFHPDGRRLAVGTGKTVRLRDAEDGRELAAFPHPAAVHSLAWRADGKVFATGCYDADIYLWDVANPEQPLRTLKGHLASVFYVSFSPGGELLASDAWDSTSRLWDPMTGEQLLSMPGSSSCDFGPGGEGIDYAWQQAGGQVCRVFHGHKKLTHVAISPNGRLMASIGDGVELWDLGARREGDKHLATLPTGTSLNVAFSPNGASLITDGSRAGLQRWPITPDPRTGGLRVGPPESLGLSERAPLVSGDPDFALTADGRTVAYCPRFGQALLYNMEDPGRKRLIEGKRLRHAAFSPDGRWLATGNWQGKGATVWDARTGELVQPLDLLELNQGAAWPAFSPDGKWLVVGTYGEYRFWEVGSWERKHGIPRTNVSARAVPVFAPDGRVLAVLRGVSDVLLVDPATGREFARLPDAGSPYCFSPDGSQLVTHGVSAGAFRVWDLRLIRKQLREMDLDWDLPPYPDKAAETAGPLQVQVLAAKPPAPSADLDAQAHLDRGLLNLQLRQYAAASDDFRRADDLAPQRLCWEDVIRAYSELIERRPQDAELHHQRAAAYARLGQWRQALDDHSRAIALAPDRPDFLAGRGKTYRRAGQRDKAAADFRKAGAQKPGVANSLAWELATAADPAEREPAEALRLARQAVRQVPGEANYWNTLGVAHYRAGEWRAAVEALEKSERLAPGKYLGFNCFFLAMCHHRLGDAAAAKDHFGRAVRWSRSRRADLPARLLQELNAFRAEAETLLGPAADGP